MTISDTHQHAGAPRPEHAPARPPRPSSKPNGQWKIDGTTPLNGNEEWKQVDGGLAVRERIETIYAQGGFASIDPTDLHGRFRWWGLYTQRKPGIDGGRTATLSAGRARRRVLHAARSHRRRPADHRAAARHRRHLERVRPRHRRPHRPPEHPAALDRGRGDARDLAPARGRRASAPPRRAATCRASSWARRSPASPRTSSSTRRRRSTRSPRGSSATSRSRTSPASSSPPSQGIPSQDVVHEINDVAFVAVEASRTRHRLRPVGRRRRCRRPRVSAERLGVFVAPEKVADAWHGVAQIFRDYGYRRLRNKARLKFLLAEWGTEKFRQVLQDEYLGYALPDGPPRRSRSRRATTSASTGRRTAGSTSASRRSSAASQARPSRSSPTSSRRTAHRACAPLRTRSS